MSEDPKPAPPWRILLRGQATDLQDLSSCLTKGAMRIGQESSLYFLESDVLDALQTPAEVSRKAAEILKVLSSVARVRRSIAKPVELNGVRWKDSSGRWRQTLTATETIIVYASTVHLASPGVFERCFELAFGHDVVRSALTDFLGEWDFPRLRRIGEAVLLDLGNGDTAKGVKNVVKKGWASEADCDRFWDAVNFGDVKSPGAHSTLRRAPGKSPMNVIQAGEFLRNLLAKWIESKI